VLAGPRGQPLPVGVVGGDDVSGPPRVAGAVFAATTTAWPRPGSENYVLGWLTLRIYCQF
jgi:hypothetical protein